MLGFDGNSDSCPFNFPTSYDVKKRIESVYVNHQAYLCKLFESLEWICVTVDIWSNKHRSYLGMTAHGLDSQTFERISVALCCTRFPHPHTGDNIAEQIQLIFATYKLSSSKVTFAIMDNAANFRKAFREHGANDSAFVEYVENTQDENEAEIDFLNPPSDNDSPFIFPEILESTVLPNRISCSCHNFNLIGTTDICGAKSDQIYKNLYATAFPKMNKLWNKTQKSKSSETIQGILGCTLGRPVNTRWNSVPECAEEIISKEPSKIDNLMTEFGIPIFTLTERQFLKEWVDVIKPITSALRNLEGSKCHFGALLPTLFTVKSRLNAFIESNDVKYCKALARALLNGLHSRFAMIDLTSKEAVPALIATCTHPHFKLRWLADQKSPQMFELITKHLFKAAEEFRLHEIGASGCVQKSSKKGSFSVYFCKIQLILKCFSFLHFFPIFISS